MEKSLKYRRNIFLLLLDIFLGAGFILVNYVKTTGIAFHEWFGILLGLVILLHIGLHWNWITCMLKKFLQIKDLKQYTKFVLDILLFTAFFTIIITGVLMSRSFLPVFGLTGMHSFTLKMLHTTSTQVTIYLIAAHLLLNLRWITNVVRRLFTKPSKAAGHRVLRPEHGYK